MQREDKKFGHTIKRRHKWSDEQYDSVNWDTIGKVRRRVNINKQRFTVQPPRRFGRRAEGAKNGEMAPKTATLGDGMEHCTQRQRPLDGGDCTAAFYQSSYCFITMSTDSVEAEIAADMCCASCGTAQVDDIKLKECDACDLVHYCSDNCQQDHRSQHEQLCTERAAELRDELLFKQPEGTHVGDCPICFLPLPINGEKARISTCCSKIICDGCSVANKRHQFKDNMQLTCPFCRHPIPSTDEEKKKNFMKRAAANDPEAMNQMGFTRENEGDYDSAIEYWSKAAELGDALAHWSLSLMYERGKGVEKDEKKEIYHLEEAAIAGHPDARCNLGCYEMRSERYDRAVKHWIIAANLGHDKSIQVLKDCYKGGLVSKEEFAAALRAHQAAVDATKSPQREEAAKIDLFRRKNVVGSK